jgi:outer membrane lipoprotein-sorting protein
VVWERSFTLKDKGADGTCRLLEDLFYNRRNNIADSSNSGEIRSSTIRFTFKLIFPSFTPYQTKIHMHKINYLKLLIILMLSGMTSSAFAQKTLDEIVNLHITAMGCPEKLSKLKSVKITAEMDVMNMQIPVTTTIVQQRGFRSETVVQGSTIIQVIDNDKGWAINPMAGQTKATPLPAEVVSSLSAETDLTGLYHYKEKGQTLTLDGEDDLGGAKVYKVTQNLKNGTKRTHYISQDTYYILKTVASMTVQGQQIESKNTQSNFKQVDGITYPFTSEVETSAMPGSTMAMKIKTLEVNPKIDESIFTMPKE